MLKSDRLCYKDRCLRIRTGKLLLGPTGERLFADYLDKKPGFCGRIDFIHKAGITSLFEVQCSEKIDFEQCESVWYPSRLEMRLKTGRIVFSEIKFITRSDCAVSCQTWKNPTNRPVRLFLKTEAEGCKAGFDAAAGCRTMLSPETPHGYSIGIAVKSDVGMEKEPVTLGPGEAVSFTIAAAVGNMAVESLKETAEKCAGYLLKTKNPVERQNEEYESFFADAPQFRCSDELLNRTWNYRWFLLRHNLAKPDFGNLQGYVMYEGRSHKSSGKPFEGFGWEFSKLINLSAPLHITDMRWHTDKRFIYDMIRNMLRAVDENGCFCSAFVDRAMASYANYGVWAVYQFWLVDGNDAFIREILPKLKSCVESEARTYASGNDFLQVEKKHNMTGKEYQPSYWYFHDYPRDPKDKATYTPLKRVDRSVYHYKNVLGLSLLCKAVGDCNYKKYDALAENIKKDILAKMWDEQTGFFYDLHYQTDEKAMVKNIVGIYPYWASVTDKKHLKGLELLFDERTFKTQCPFPSVARDCPAYRPAGGWMDTFIKGRNGCVWCGPSWPYTTGIAVDMLGIQSRLNGHRYDDEFGFFLREYAYQHFRDRDINRPYLVEHYNAETGEPLSDEADYNHSFFIDLIITHLAGIQITQNGVAFDPIDIGLDYFVLDNIHIRSDSYRVTCKAENCNDAEAADLAPGYHVFKNGTEISAQGKPHSAPSLAGKERL